MRQKEHRIYNPAMECIDREQLRKLQGERLAATVKREYENVPMYRARMDAAGVKPEDIDGSGLQGLKAQQVIHAAIESLNTGRIVYLDEMFPKK